MKAPVFILIALASIQFPQAQNVGIGNTEPDSSAILDITSTTMGLLLPRMTYDQRNGIPDPAEGLVIWCTDCNEMQVFDGEVWKNFAGNIASSPSPPFVRICNQDWMYANLDVTTYINGDPIPKVTSNTEWAALTTGAYCYFNNDSATYAAIYGKLYNWYAVNDPRGLVPEGWHVATDADWTTLTNCLGGFMFAGGKLKETGLSYWNSPNEGATNSTGFSGRPGGDRYNNGTFDDEGYYGLFWTSTAINSTDARYRVLEFDTIQVSAPSNSKKFGFSVRCVRD